MNTVVRATLAGLAALGSVGAQADCVEPAAFDAVPSGATATREVMVAAQHAIKEYDLAIKQYTVCLEKSGDMSAREDLALSHLHKIADRFNDELRAFKQKNGA